MSDDTPQAEPTLVERWLKDQQEWHKMAMEYYDSMVNNEDFLTHMGNAMRGSLLAGKAYPGTQAPDQAATAPDANARIDELMHAIHRLQGEVNDLRMTLEDLQVDRATADAQPSAAPETGEAEA